ncbi:MULTISPECIES: LacI family DNA-binding transcriptional regulator [unclassified Vibrio]|uniref:LacI family DNA-binding transcriptional regulator n=1 Tax=unclassified Vibrio TaxID=2614977 RepID=UPI000B8E4B85|nr:MULTISPECIES: LacI family DNA-binding transcriptional regulator [unclassified Vibrio]NAW97136.1 substrate-binding domain-containing protein [Vibrio sp. V23_P3S9T160]OXX40393.1 LacI family transcriptional regulator [Vibrio sp. V11_P1A41T118]
MSESRKRRSTGKVTIADVAAKAGVGTMTVSRALRTPELVSSKLREKIEFVVEELGYIPNKAAGALASGENYSIALIIPSLIEKSCAVFLPNFQHSLNRQGYQLLLGYSDYSIDNEEKLLATFLESQPAAVVLFGSEHSSKSHQLLQRANIPVIEIAELNESSTYLNVGVDYYKVGKQCTQHLIENRYQNIGFIGARSHHSVLRNELRGWQSALIDNYQAPDHFLTTHEAPSAHIGKEGISKLLLRDSTLDAVVCSHEEIALGVLFECQRRLIKVPTEMAIICLDGSSLCQYAFPAISAAHVNYEQLGLLAAERLLKQIKEQTLELESTNVGFQLQKRASTVRP